MSANVSKLNFSAFQRTFSIRYGPNRSAIFTMPSGTTHPASQARQFAVGIPPCPSTSIIITHAIHHPI
jgi:hypothetical protein